MSSIVVVVDTSQADALLSQIQETTDNLGEGLLQAVEQAFIPDVEMLSQTIYAVRTGQYYSSWVAEAVGGNMVVVTNTAESLSDGYPYSLSLEYGWKSHPGGYVGTTAAEGSAEGIGQALLDWVMEQLPNE